MNITLPDKMYFKIGEVANLATVKPSVLRFWETEFSSLTPTKSRTGQRLYTRRDVELVLEIKYLLYNEKLTIEGARQRLSRSKLSKRSEAEPIKSQDALISLLREVRQELLDLKKALK